MIDQRSRIRLYSFLALSGLGLAMACSPPRDKDLSYPSKLWRVYDDRPRFGFFGDRALPKGPFLRLTGKDGGVEVASNKGTRNLWGRNFGSPLMKSSGNLPSRLETKEGMFSMFDGEKKWDSKVPAGEWGTFEIHGSVAGIDGPALAFSNGDSNLYIGTPGKKNSLNWEKISMGLYIEGAKDIVGIFEFRGGLIVGSNRGLAVCRGAPFKLWQVLGKGSGLPDNEIRDVEYSGGDLWVLYPDRLYRSSEELLRLLAKGFSPS